MCFYAQVAVPTPQELSELQAIVDDVLWKGGMPIVSQGMLPAAEAIGDLQRLYNWRSPNLAKLLGYQTPTQAKFQTLTPWSQNQNTHFGQSSPAQIPIFLRAQDQPGILQVTCCLLK